MQNALCQNLSNSRIQSMLSDRQAKTSFAFLSFSARRRVLDVLGGDFADKFLQCGPAHATPNVLARFTYKMSDLMGCYRTFPNLPEISSTVKQRFKPQHLLKGYGAVAKMHSRAQQAAVIKFNKRPAQPVRNVCQDLKSCKPCRS